MVIKQLYEIYIPRLRQLLLIVLILRGGFTGTAQSGESIVFANDFEHKPTDARINALFAYRSYWINNAEQIKFLDSLKVITREQKDKRFETFLTIFEASVNSQPIEALEKISEASSSPEIKAFCSYTIGMSQFVKRDYAKGLTTLFKAKKQLEELHFERLTYAPYIFSGYFGVHYEFEDYTTASKYCQLMIDHYSSGSQPLYKTYNNLGVCFIKTKEYDKAKAAFEKGLVEVDKVGDNNFKALILGNVGNVLRIQGHFREALPYLYQDAILNEKAIPENAAISRLYIANALLNLDSVAKAAQYIKPPDFVIPPWTLTPYKLTRYETLALYYQKTGDYASALHYKDSLIAFKDTLQALFDANDAKRLAVLEASISAEQQSLNEKQQAEKAKFLMNIIIIVLTLLFGSILLFYYNQIKQKKLLELEKQKQIDVLQQLDSAKTRFYANVSHELRTPLTLLLAPLSTVLKSGSLDNRNFTLVRLARQNAQGLLKLVNEILDLNKLEASKLELHEEKTVVYNFLRRIIAGFESSAEINDIDFTFDYQSEKYLQIWLDNNKFEKILNNLLSNAFKFTKPKGSVVVTVKEVQNTLTIAVKDTGRGIHPDDLPHIFNRFYQSNQVDALTEGGTGIGLSLSMELAKLMGGQLFVESILGQGSTFTFELPKKEVMGTIPTPEAEEMQQEITVVTEGVDLSSLETAESSNDSKPTILIVEDNHGLRDYLSLILNTNYTILKAENGQAALDMMNNEPSPTDSSIKKLPDLILSDVMMPIMDGFQLLSALKMSDVFCSIPVIMLTARAELQDKLKALRIGVDDYLIKPFEEEELSARIENLLKNAQHRQIAQQETINAIEKEQEAPEIPPLSKDDLKWLFDLENVLRENISDYNLSTNRMADMLHISRSQFYSRIRLLTGMTPIEYLQEIRFNHARLLLEQRTVSSVKSAAAAVGMRHVQNFSHHFKIRFGKLPSDYLG